MIQQFIKPPIINSHISNVLTDHCSQNNNIVLVGTKLNTNYRTLIQFDLSSAPLYSTIINATFNIFVTQNECPDTSSSLGIFQVLSEWDSKTINWNEQPLVSAAPVDSISVNNQADTLLTFNVTTLVQDWVSNRSVNMGLMLKFIDESHCYLLAIASNKYRDSRFWPYLELNLLDQITSERNRMLRAIPLEESVTVLALSSIQFTSSLDVLVYDYSYLVINIGGSPAVAYLQISPDGTNWEDQSDTKTINPGVLISFVPDVIAKYARLAYTLPPGSTLTPLQVYTQGRSYN